MIKIFIQLTVDNIPYGLHTVMNRPFKGELIRLNDYSHLEVDSIQHIQNNEELTVFTSVVHTQDVRQLIKCGFNRLDI